ncbi:fungal-specific transcription factor domain-containing protein [Mycena maculata]|uniref:Fungal-specific transcription factor domain-containing protein n=1 Tax=Mycena maculata TaxID=230809 RepID=A0AAD7JIJ6_9AGAR|nr:fungal-specific transcription factor domain-containing protein [Mycena maculata]
MLTAMVVMPSQCAWGRDAAPRKPRTEAHFEALRKRADSLQAYVDMLEKIIAKCSEEASGYNGMKVGNDSENDALESDEEITQELTARVQRLKLDDNLGALLLHGITSPFQFGNRLPHEVSRLTYVTEKSPASYLLLLEGVEVSGASPDIDWSRYLPPEVKMDRKEHDKILDLSFKFFTMWALRLVPALFLKDMHRALSVPRSQPPLRTQHYSPMLHNAVLSVSALFSDDPHIQDVKTRGYFTDAAKRYLEAECQKPSITLVQALAFIGTYYGNTGDRIQGDLYTGMASRLGISLGLGVDSKAWVKSGLMTQDEMIDRNWAYWSIFCLDVCWALFFSRDFAGPPLDRRSVSLPFVDSESDQIPWHYPPSNIPPQPNFLSLSFYETTSLFVIAYKIIDIVTGLNTSGGIRPELIKVDAHVTKLDLELNTWKSCLPPELNITLANRAKSTPQRLMLHLTYWWCFIVLHRPFFNRRARVVQTSDREIDHVKLCKRAAENIMELVETWSSLYTLRYIPITITQVLFGAGTIFLLLALQATSSLRIAHGSLKTALAQVEQCIHYLHETGRTWASSTRSGNILHAVLHDKLRPIILRRLAHKGLEPTAVVMPTPPPDASASPSPRPRPFSDIGDLNEPSMFTALAPERNLPSQLALEWSQMPVDYSAPPSDGGYFGDTLNQLAGQNMFPALDASGVFPTFDPFGAPELWEQTLFSTDSSTLLF